MQKLSETTNAASTRNYRNLDVWSVAMQLAVGVYAAAERLPASERFELSSQIRRAAVSVPANIAEGYSTGLDGLLLRHLRLARGSVGEIETQLELAVRLRLLRSADISEVVDQLSRTGKLLNGLIRAVRAKRIQKLDRG